MAKRTHKDVEFAVDDASGNERIFRTFDEAAGFAVAIALSGARAAVNIDVLIHSVAGARWYGGDLAVEEYETDPDASVSDRIQIKVDHWGRVA